MEDRFLNLENELIINASRSGGKGGQNVNKVSTKIDIFFNIWETAFLTDGEKELAARRLGKRIDKNGNIRVISQKERTQYLNRVRAISKLKELISKAIEPEKARVATKPTRTSKLKRLGGKKVISDKKKMRRQRVWGDDD